MRVPKSWLWADMSVVLMVVGAFGPWAKADTGIPLSVTIKGTEGGKDGWLVIGAAAVAAVALVLHLAFRRQVLPTVALLAGCAGAAVAGYDISDLERSDPGGLYSAQWGIYLALGGSISLALASVVLMVSSPRAER